MTAIPTPKEVRAAIDAAKEADSPVFNNKVGLSGTAWTTMNRVAQADKILRALFAEHKRTTNLVYRKYRVNEAMAAAAELYKEKS